jgi:hypothetical protein
MSGYCPECGNTICMCKEIERAERPHARRVHAIDMSQERVDKTVKRGHEPVAWREVVGKTTMYYDYNEQGRGEPLYAAPVHAIDMSQDDLVYRLRKRAEIRRQIPDRKSVQEGQPDRIADLLEEAADALEKREWTEQPDLARVGEVGVWGHKREWVGLTDGERRSIQEWQRIQEELGPVWAPMMLYLYLAIEAKLKEKNCDR